MVRLLVDALQQAIAVSVRGQFSPAIECMSNLLRPQVGRELPLLLSSLP